MIFVGEVCPFSSGSWDSSEITGKNQAPDTGHGLALVSMNNSGLLLFSENCIDLVQFLCNYWGIIDIKYGYFCNIINIAQK